jgi:hypothetical protein
VRGRPVHGNSCEPAICGGGGRPTSGSRGGHHGEQATDHHHFLGVVNEHGRKSGGRAASSMED